MVQSSSKHIAVERVYEENPELISFVGIKGYDTCVIHISKAPFCVVFPTMKGRKLVFLRRVYSYLEVWK